MEVRSSERVRTLVTQMARSRRGLSANENARALISMMARSKCSNQRPDSQDSSCSLAYLAYSREDIVPFRLCRAGRWQGRQELPREARAAIKQTAGTRVSTGTLVPGLFC